MKILLTGCTGHISSYLIRTLPPKYEIVGYDNMMGQRYSSLFNLPHPIEFHDKGFEYITEEDLRDINCVIHAAAVTDAVNASRENIQSINIDKTKQFIDLCFEYVPRFVFFSSTSVYGSATNTVYEDDNEVINPQSFYAQAKLEIENYIKEKDSLTRYLILRLATICGVSIGMRFHTVCQKFCYDAIFHNKLKVWKQNFEMYRPYLTLGDLSGCLDHLLSNNLWDQTYNVVSDNIQLSNLVNFIDCQFHRPLNIEFVDTPLLNQFSYFVSNDKLKQTGFNFKGNIYKEILNILSLLGKK